MSALQVAGNSLVNGPGAGPMRGGGPKAMSTLGVRSLREEYSKPVHRTEIPRNLELIEERLAKESQVREPVASEERLEIPRFQHLFKGGELLPPAIFQAGLELGPVETLNGRQMPFDADVLVLRDNLIMAYKPLVHKIRLMNSKEIEELPYRPVLAFTRAWTAFESAWLRNREVHAVEALQPLAKAILALEPLLLSAEKEKLLPYPRVQAQKVVTLKCLEGFFHALSELTSSVLPSQHRELDHDPKLILLMDHVLSLRGDKSVGSCLEGVCSTPEVAFPDHQRGPPSPSALREASGGRDKAMTLDAYAFKLLGASVGDALASGKLKPDTKLGESLVHSMGPAATKAMMPQGPQIQGQKSADPKEGDLSRRAAKHASELLLAFESVKDVLLALKSMLEHIDPSLDRDEAFMAHLMRFEKASRKAKRLFLEPDNLA